MIKGIYTSASGMIPRVRKQEIIANNISNAKTVGFKKDTTFTRELSRAERKQMPKQSDWETPMLHDVFVDFSAGMFDKTGNPLDLAIDGDGFFTVQAEDGTTYLTRAGTFEVNAQGQLAFPNGMLLVSNGGAIDVGDGQVSVGEDGSVDVDGSTVGRITPMTVDDLTQLEKAGDSMFLVPEGTELTAATNSSIRQGYLEEANVDIVREMVDMIITYRTFEANAKALQSQDNSLDNLFRRVASNG